MTPEQREAGKMLVLLILKERHPEPMAHAELRTRFVDLVREHGDVFKALEHMKRMQRQ